jgi:hypothetical protein
MSLASGVNATIVEKRSRVPGHTQRGIEGGSVWSSPFACVYPACVARQFKLE